MITIYLVTSRIAEGPPTPGFFFLHLGMACNCAGGLSREGFDNETFEVWEMEETMELVIENQKPKFGVAGLRTRRRSS